MMRWLVSTSLKLRRLVLALAVGVVALGIWLVDDTPVDVLPEFDPPLVEVQTEALGLSAAEVEQLITVPLEQDLLVGVPFLDEIESVSLPGLSSVVMTFEPGTDVLDARQVVQERLTQAVGIAGLPAVAKPPQMIQPLSSSSRVSMVKLTSEELSPIEMSVLARWVITPRLLGVPGVANVAVWGNRDRQVQVLVDPERLQQQDVTLNEVVRTTGNALEVSPLSYLEASKPGTGGFIDTPNQRLNIFHEQAISTPEELAQVPLEGTGGAPVQGTGGPLALGDVTDVVEDHQPLIGDTVCQGGQKCLILVVERFPDSNTLQVSDGVESALASLRPGLADMQIDSSVYRPASYIEATFENLELAALVGAGLLLVVLLLLFWDWRRTLVVAAGVAVACSAAALVLIWQDVTVNVLVVTGIVVGLTVVVDDLVTDTDGLVRRIAHHRETGTSAPVWTAIVETTSGLKRSALVAALVVAVMLTPLFFLWDDGAAFLPPLVLSYLLAVATALVVGLVLTPVLAMLLLSSGQQRRPAPLTRVLHRRYDRTAPRMVARTGAAVATLAVLAVAGLLAMPFLDTAFRPELQERSVLVDVQAAPGTSLTRMTAIADQAVEELGDLPGITAASAQIGRAVMSDQIVDVDQGEIWLTLDREADYASTVASVEDAAADLPGVVTEVSTYTAERVGETLQGDDSDVVVRAYGDNPEVLAAKAEELRGAIADVDGVTRVNVEPTPQESTVEVQVDLARAQALGIKPGDVRRSAAILLGGITAGNLFEQQKVFDVVVWGTPGIRQSMGDIEKLLIDTPDGGTVRLGDVAEVRNVPNDAVIRHESVTRYVELTADVSGRDVGDVNRDVDAVVAGLSFPLDHHAEVLAGYADRAADQARLIAVALTAALVVFLIFQSAFRSWRLAALASVAMAVCLVGGLLGTLVTGGNVTLGVVVGLIAVAGLAARGVVGTIGGLLHLERRERVPFGPELVLRGTRERLAPTVTSVLAIAVALAPVAVTGGTAGLEILHPAAITILGGLVSTTLVTLFVLPVIYLRLGSVPDVDSWADDLYAPSAEMRPSEV